MAITVFAEGMGYFHKGSGGKGVAPADVCLTPPPPPTGPVPVPYVNMLQASNLTKGSKKVKIDGEPTALESQSEVSTSNGDEAGTQGGNVITHKTKGKGSFKLWSFVVKAENKGVCLHGHPMGQNSMSDPPGCVDAAAVVKVDLAVLKAFRAQDWVKDEPCTEKYVRRNVEDRAKYRAQKASVKPAARCWSCPNITTVYKQWTPDHQPPMSVAWYIGGCHDPEKFKKWANKNSTVKPHCNVCTTAQRNATSSIVSPARAGDFAGAMTKIKTFLQLS